MDFANKNWMQLEAYLQKDNRVILVLGACEQHGYLSLLTDVKIPEALAQAASLQSDVIVAPSLSFGCSPYFLDYPGTISIRLHTYLDLVEDILRSLYGSGFRKCLILNPVNVVIWVPASLMKWMEQTEDWHFSQTFLYIGCDLVLKLPFPK